MSPIRYVLSSAVIPAPGTYRYTRLSLEEARQALAGACPESFIGYATTAAALALVTGQHFDVNRARVPMRPGDSALVFRLKERVTDPAVKGRLTVAHVKEKAEVGLLERLA